MSDPGIKIIVTNRRARHEYHLEKPIEAGMVLQGSEVKSLRAGRANLQEAFVGIGSEGATLFNLHIAPYEMGGYANHEPTRPRRLLLHRSEIEKLRKGTEQQGFTIVPLKLYFKNGRAKVEIALGKGKKLHDKRHDIAARDEKRRLDRLVRR
ncbi:MAG: SsrA-binding protein SmpB [Rubricoccaceae bacterium]|nr:SsrA-binding protein SmpB [Rubricoccaceae bacterium]